MLITPSDNARLVCEVVLTSHWSCLSAWRGEGSLDDMITPVSSLQPLFVHCFSVDFLHLTLPSFFLFWLSLSLHRTHIHVNLLHPWLLFSTSNLQPCVFHSILSSFLVLGPLSFSGSSLALPRLPFLICLSHYLPCLSSSFSSPLFTPDPSSSPHPTLPSLWNLPMFYPHPSHVPFCFVTSPFLLSFPLYSSLCRSRTPCSWTRQRSS